MANWWDTIKKDLTSEPLSTNMSSNDRPNVGNGSKVNEPVKRKKESEKMAEKLQVDMENGTVQAFGAKQKMIKNTQVADDGTIESRFEFKNGRVVEWTMPGDMISKFACHGADQKFGDAIAGILDIDDCVLAVEDLAARLDQGEWSMKREGGSFAGTSVLQRALCEMTGKSVDEIKDFLTSKTQAEKVALRNNPKVRPFVEKIEAEKASKTSNKVDTDALLGELE